MTPFVAYDLTALCNLQRIRNAFESESFRCFIREADTIELLVMEGIGEGGSTAREVAGMLAENRGKPVNVRINSPGGLVFDGLGIFNALALHDAPVTTTVEGIAASAAAIIAMAGKPLRMLENSSLYVHRAMGLGFGNRDVMADLVETLDKIDEALINTVASRRGLQRRDVRSLMVGKVDGTILTAAEAKRAGLADEVVSLSKSARNAMDAAEPVEPLEVVAERDRWLAEARRNVERLALETLTA